MAMSLRGRLTLWSVLLMALIVGLSAWWTSATKCRPNSIQASITPNCCARWWPTWWCRRWSGSAPRPCGKRCAIPTSSSELVDVLTASRTLLEIAVCDRNNEILADSDPGRLGKTFENYADFAPLVTNTTWWGKLQTLFSDKRYYQLEQPLAAGGQTILYVRVVVYPR